MIFDLLEKWSLNRKFKNEKLFEKKVNDKSPNSITGLSSFQSVESENKYGNEQKRIRNHDLNMHCFIVV